MKVILVDKKDKIIGYKDRDKISPEDTIRISVLWIYNSKGEILLAKRSKNKKFNPGKWGPSVAGTLEKGETYYSNIQKESWEELGTTFRKIQRKQKKFLKLYNNLFAQWYSLKSDKPLSYFRIQKSEIEKIKWFTKKEIIDDVRKNPKKFTPGVHLLVKEKFKSILLKNPKKIKND